MRAPAGIALVWLAGCAPEGPARDVAIAPVAPTTLDDLVATVDLADAEAAAFDLVWSRDGEHVAEVRGDRVPAALTTRGEVWTVELHAAGRGASAWVAGAASVQVRNAPPWITRLAIDPPDPRADDPVALVAGEPADPDGDEVTLRAEWFLDGARAATGELLPARAGVAGQRLEVVAAPFDGFEEGPERRVDAVLLREPHDGAARWAIASGTSCYLQPDGRAACWGHAFGEDPEPRFVGGDLRFSAIAAGWSFVCGVALDGEAWCWGALRTAGGRFAITAAPVPIARPAGPALVSMAAGSGVVCAVDRDGRALCGELGDTQDHSPDWGSGDSLAALAVVGRLPPVGSVAVGSAHACAIALDGAAWCWGEERHGVLGRADLRPGGYGPAPIDREGPWRRVAAGQTHSCALDRGRVAWCWGSNAWGQLATGLGPLDRGPGRVIGGHRWLWIDAGPMVTCAVRDDETLWCWGDNADGLVGDGSRVTPHAPVQIGGPGPWRTVAVGPRHACADQVDGSRWCWGRNNAGEIGDGTREYRLVPTRVASADGG